LAIFVVDVRSPTHCLTPGTRHFECGNRGRSDSDNTIGVKKSDLALSPINMGYPTHPITQMTEYIKYENRYLWVVESNNRFHNRFNNSC